MNIIGQDEATSSNDLMTKSQEEDRVSTESTGISFGVKRVKKKTTSEKVSTGCGPSPPRESPPPRLTAPATSGTASTGTSPLPQSISTQTYESPEELRQSTSTSVRPTSSTADESLGSTRRRNSRQHRRDSRRSRRSPEPEHLSRSDRSHSRLSFSSDRSIGTPAREWSPTPGPAPEEEWWRETGPVRSRSNSLMQHQRPRASLPRRPPPRRASHLDLYRDREDLRWRRDFGDPYMYPDVRDVYGSQPDVTRAISLETLAAARRQTDVIRSQGMELVKLLREAEKAGYTAEELHVATQLCGALDPVRWLQENWHGMVASVQTVASKMGRESGAGDTVGTLSEKEAREALRTHKGSVWQAVTDCIKQRQKKYGELMSRGKFSREEVLTCLTAHHGDLEAAYLDLTKNQLKPFLMKIWGPPEGVENDSGNPLPGTSAKELPSTSTSKITAEGVDFNNSESLKKFQNILNRDSNAHPDASVSGNVNQSTENPQVPHQNGINLKSGTENPLQNKESADILAGLKSLLSRAGIPVSEQSLLSGLKNIMQVGDNKIKPPENTSNRKLNPERNLISSSIENDFIQAYNALTCSSPLPSIDKTDSTRSSLYFREENFYSTPHRYENQRIYQDSENNNINNNSVSTSSISRKYSDEPANQNKEIHTSNEITRTSINNTYLEQDRTNNQNFDFESQHRTMQQNHDESTDDRSQHLSKIVTDTHRLVQKMKEEINSDITSFDEGEYNTEFDNESSVTPEFSDHDSYTESSSRSESDSPEEPSEVNERQIQQNEHISKTSRQNSTSDENEQFEEAIDNMDVEQSNIAALDAIVKSLQDIQTGVNSSNIQEHQHQLELNVDLTNLNQHSNEIGNSHETTSTPRLVDQSFHYHDEIVENRTQEYFKSKNGDNIVNTDNNFVVNTNEESFSNALNNVNSQVHEEIVEDYNNNTMTVNTFEELYESLSFNGKNMKSQPSTSHNKRSHTPEVIISETVQSNTLIDVPMPFVSTHKIQIVDIENNQNENLNEYDKKNEIKSHEKQETEHHYPEISETASGIVSSPNSQEHQIDNNSVSITNNHKNQQEHISTSKENIKNQKSNIPKLKMNSNNGLHKSDIKSPTKVITSRVPIRRHSLKQSNTQISQKMHFGNIQSGHVKKLQSSLFGTNKSLKIPMPVSKKNSAKTGLALVQPMPSKIITIQSDNSAEKAKTKSFFQETCLSDDYLTETDDEAGRMERSTRARSEPAPASESEQESEALPVTTRIVNGKLVDFTQVPLKDGSPERQVRMLVAEGVVESWQQAEVAVALAARGEPPAAALLAALHCDDLPSAIDYLNQDCELCAGTVPTYEMVSMLCCTHRCCRECARTYFTVQISERSIFDCVCPFCKLPELAAASAPGDEDHEDQALKYFSRLEHALKSVVDLRVLELLQRKLRDRALLQDPNFKWCIECSSGFFVHPRQKRVKCPECRTVTCARCRKPWEKQHEGVSCEEFEQWKQDNNPETSLQAVQKHLQDNGIDCPKCNFKYSLSRGGCMHFTCSQCKYEFCCGCGKPFMMGAQCGLSEYCARLGLHAHHPRNCLFYLRDKEPHQLETLLQMNNIEFNKEPADAAEEATGAGEHAGGGGRRPRRCPVALQKETPAGLVDTTCHADVPPHHAGLCKNHYLEYLSRLIRRHALDPITILQTDDLETLVRRAALKLPPKPYGSLEGIYRTRLLEIVREKIPLD